MSSSYPWCLRQASLSNQSSTVCWLCFRPDVQLIDEYMERVATGELELEAVQIVNPCIK